MEGEEREISVVETRSIRVDLTVDERSRQLLIEAWVLNRIIIGNRLHSNVGVRFEQREYLKKVI